MSSGLTAGDRQAITRIVHEYCTRIDDGDFGGFAELFRHSSWVIEGEPASVFQGRDEVFEFVAANVLLYDGGRPNTRHLTSNLDLDGDSTAGTAEGTCSLAVFQAVPPDFPLQPIFVGSYRDRFERIDGEWHFTERSIRPDLVGDLTRHRSDVIAG